MENTKSPRTSDLYVLQLACPSCPNVRRNREVMDAVRIILYQITKNYLTTNVSEKQCLKQSHELNELALKVACPRHGNSRRGCNAFPF